MVQKSVPERNLKRRLELSGALPLSSFRPEREEKRGGPVEAGSQAEAGGLGLGIPYSSQFHSPIEAEARGDTIGAPPRSWSSSPSAPPLDLPQGRLDRDHFLQQLVPLV
jgi:hypothetical protein